MEMLHGKKLIDSIEEQLCAAIGGSHERAQEFLSLRRKEIMGGENCGSRDILRKYVSPIGKIRLLLLFFRCRRIIELLVDVHGHEIFRAGTWNGDPHFGKRRVCYSRYGTSCLEHLTLNFCSSFAFQEIVCRWTTVA